MFLFCNKYYKNMYLINPYCKAVNVAKFFHLLSTYCSHFLLSNLHTVYHLHCFLPDYFTFPFPYNPVCNEGNSYNRYIHISLCNIPIYIFHQVSCFIFLSLYKLNSIHLLPQKVVTSNHSNSKSYFDTPSLCIETY